MPFSIEFCRLPLLLGLPILCLHLPICVSAETPTIFLYQAKQTDPSPAEEIELSEQIRQALADHHKRKEKERERRSWQDHALGYLIETLRDRGHIISIGSPDAEDEEAERIILTFPVTITASDELRRAIADLGKAYSGDIPRMAEAKIEELLNNQSLYVSVFLKSGAEYKSGPYNLQFRSPRSYDLKLLFDPQHFVVKMGIPSQLIDQTSSVKGLIITRFQPGEAKKDSSRNPAEVLPGIDRNARLPISEANEGKSSPSPLPIIGNRKSHIYHRQDCPNYREVAPSNRVAFNSVDEAEEAGYRMADNCP